MEQIVALHYRPTKTNWFDNLASFRNETIGILNEKSCKGQRLAARIVALKRQSQAKSHSFTHTHTLLKIVQMNNFTRPDSADDPRREWHSSSFWGLLNDQVPVVNNILSINVVNFCRFSEDTLPGEVITRMVAYDADLDSRVKIFTIGIRRLIVSTNVSSGWVLHCGRRWRDFHNWPEVWRALSPSHCRQGGGGAL